MHNLEEYLKIIDYHIKKDFPNLKDQKIIIKEKSNVRYQAHVMYYPWAMIIYVNRTLRTFPAKSARRILFHELCHLNLFKKDGMIKTNMIYIEYILSKKIRKKVEAEANILMIKKGWGKEVLAARKENLQRGIGFSLTEEEIKDKMKKFKKKSK